MHPIIISRGRMNYARIYIGVDQGMDMSKSISLKSKLGIWTQCTEYEYIHFSCFHCNKSRHWAKRCPFLKVAPKKVNKFWVRKVLNNHNSSKSRGETLGVEVSLPSLGFEKV